MQRYDCRRVLIADDDVGACETLADILVSEGFTVKTVDNGNAAIGAARAERFEVAFIDQRMPGLEGLEVVRALRLIGEEFGGKPSRSGGASTRTSLPGCPKGISPSTGLWIPPWCSAVRR
jgi:CheY-like chemotaxis protein